MTYECQYADNHIAQNFGGSVLKIVLAEKTQIGYFVQHVNLEIDPVYIRIIGVFQ